MGPIKPCKSNIICLICKDMIERSLYSRVSDGLQNNPAVALLGPRQVGKTTLAHHVADGVPSLYLDMESPADLAKLQDPESYLSGHLDKLVILDEIQRVPDLFPILRGLIDRARLKGDGDGRYLILGSASIDLLNQSSESLAGRIQYLELNGLTPCELEATELDTLWLRGGFPRSVLAETDSVSAEWREDFIRTYLERDIPQLGPRVPSTTLRRFWTMLAHQQGGNLNAAKLALGLDVSSVTIFRYLDLLVDLLLARRLQPWHTNAGKRLVKSPKVYVRDSGIVHQLLGIPDGEALLSHPVVGMSWEGFAIENLLASAPRNAEAYYYRTSTGVEMDLLLQFPGQELWAIEIKRTSAPKLSSQFKRACSDLDPNRKFILYNGTETYTMGYDTYAIGLLELMRECANQ